MKKLFFFFVLTVVSSFPLAAKTVLDERNFYFQKQIFINEQALSGDEKGTCQAVQLERNWFLTAAHCVAPFMDSSDCRIRIVMARGDLGEASAVIPCSSASLPPQVMNKDKGPILPFDMALLHVPGDIAYEYYTLGGEPLSEGEFNSLLRQDDRLRAQWKARTRQKYPVLYTYQDDQGKLLLNSILVPLWKKGEASYLSSEDESVLYLGKNLPTVWVTDSFGVTNGNSGGAVMVVLPHGKLGLLGIVSAKEMQNFPPQLVEEIHQDVPRFGNAGESFLFNGFADDYTLRFIRQTLGAYRVNVKAKKIRKIMLNPQEAQDQPLETRHIEAK